MKIKILLSPNLSLASLSESLFPIMVQLTEETSGGLECDTVLLLNLVKLIFLLALSEGDDDGEVERDEDERDNGDATGATDVTEVTEVSFNPD